MNERITELAEQYRPQAFEMLKEAIRIPADYVNHSIDKGGDPYCGLSNHEGPRLEYFRQRILELGAVRSPADVGSDEFGNLWWTVYDPSDGIPEDEKTVIFMDGHTDTVQALRKRWHESVGPGLDPYLGMTNMSQIDWPVLSQELGYLPPVEEHSHLIWGRGAADQLGGVVCQIIAAKILRELRSEGSLRGVIIRSLGTVSEEDNDGGGPMYILRKEVPVVGPGRIPHVVLLTEGTGCAEKGALGIYRGQRGRMQIEVEITGKSCHGSMPWEGRNPLEYGAAIIAEAADRHSKGEGFGNDPFLGRGTRTASDANLQTPSDCAVPERFTFRFDRRLTAGEDPIEAIEDVKSMSTVRRAIDAGLYLHIHAPIYCEPTWRGYTPDNPQIYPGWVTPENHPVVKAGVETYEQVSSPIIQHSGATGLFHKEPRVDRWVFSTDGVGYCIPVGDYGFSLPAGKSWVTSGSYHHPPMIGIGPGIEQNTHKIGECVDSRELAPVIAFLARFPSLYRQSIES